MYTYTHIYKNFMEEWFTYLKADSFNMFSDF